MATTKPIAGLQRGPDFDREAYEPNRVERVERSIKDDASHKQPEANDPLIRAAIDAAGEVADAMGTKVDIKYDTNSGMVIMAVTTADGEKILRYVPPEEMIRQAQRQKQQRAQMLESII